MNKNTQKTKNNNAVADVSGATFAEKVRAYRQKIGISQEELARTIGVSKRTVQNYETAGMYPKQREVYKKLADVFGVDTNYLLTEGEELIANAYETFGISGMRDMKGLVNSVCGMFAGGTLPEEDMDAAMKAISDAYFAVKQENKKYGKKNKK